MKVRACDLVKARALAQACPCPAPGPRHPPKVGRPGPDARSQHYLFHGFQLTNKVTKRKDKSMCARRDAIAQRSSPVLASNRATAPGSGANQPSVTIRPPIPTPINGLSPSELRRIF